MHSRFLIPFLLLGVQSSLSLTANPQKVIGNSEGAFETIRHALKKADIIDDIVDDFMPQCLVAPFYEKKKKEYPVALGNTLKPSKTKNSPSLEIYCPKLQETPGLTIVLTDPDAPSRNNPKWSEMCHWIAIVYTEGQSPFEIALSQMKDEVVEYKPPGPPPKTGYHRYVFLLLEGDNTNLTAPEDRQHWGFGKKGHGVRDWAEKEGLEVIGANFFYAKNKKQ